jgi:uncharacterized membrane protein YfcA
MLDWISLGIGTLIAGTLAAVTGFGGAAILLPLLVAIFGVRAAIPVLTVAQLIDNGSRVWFNRNDLDWRVVRWFALGSVPAAIVGSLLFAYAPLSALTRLPGIFLIGIVAYRHIRKRTRAIPVLGFAPLGAIASFLSALIGTAGRLRSRCFSPMG